MDMGNTMQGSDTLPVLELVGGGLAEWPAGQGPRGETLAPAVFVDADGHDDLIALPAHFHEVGIPGWQCRSRWEVEPLALVIEVTHPVERSFRVALDRGRHAPIIDALLRDGGCYVSPTSPRLGISARMMLNHSFYCPIDCTFADTWKAQQAHR